MPKKTANKETKVFVLIASLIAVVLTALFVKNSMTDVDTNNSGTEPTQVVQPVVAPPEVPEGWEQYVNEEYGYSFWYPEKYVDNKNSGYGYKTYIQELRGIDGISDRDLFGIKGIDSLGGVVIFEMNETNAANERIREYENYSIERRVELDEKIEFSGYKARKIVYVSTEDDREKFVDIFIENDNSTYVLHWVSSAYGLDFNSFGKEILSTFRLQ